MKPLYLFVQAPLSLALIALTGAAWAGRPLTVDDAGVNEKAAGHVEMWVARGAGKVSTFNISPAYAPVDNVEIAGLLSRDSTAKLTTKSLQVKWRITATQEKGCNVAAAFGLLNTSPGGGNGVYVNGSTSCNGMAIGNFHLNLGGVKSSNAPFNSNWGMALEKEMGSVTPHIEYFGNEGAKPTVQVGIRTEIKKGIQLDGTVGRNAGDMVYSLGVKFFF